MENDVVFLWGVSEIDAMTMFDNRDDFRRWLEGKPYSWAQILACRAALRVLPLAVRRLPTLTFRALGIAWTARNIPAQDMSTAATRAASTPTTRRFSRGGAAPGTAARPRRKGASVSSAASNAASASC